MLQLKLAIGDWVYVNILGSGQNSSEKGWKFSARVAPSSGLKPGVVKYELEREIVSELSTFKTEICISPVAIQECKDFSGVTFRREDRIGYRSEPFDEKLEQDLLRYAYKDKLCFIGETYFLKVYGFKTAFEIVGTNSLESELENLCLSDCPASNFSCSDTRNFGAHENKLNSQTNGSISDASQNTGRAETFFHRPEFGFLADKAAISLLFDLDPERLDINDDYQNEPKICGFAKFGGYQSLKNRLQKEIITRISCECEGYKLFQTAHSCTTCRKKSYSPYLFGVKGILIHGCTGVGKSLLANMIIEELKIDPQYVFTEIDRGTPNRPSRASSVWRPCVYILDDLQFKLIGSGIAQKGGGSEQNLNEKIFPADIRRFFDKLRVEAKREVLVIGVCSDIEMLDIALRRDKYFELEYEISAPSQKDRLSILTVLNESSFSHVSLHEEDLREISEQTHGYTASDLISLLKLVSMEMDVDNVVWKDIIGRVRPSAMKEIVLDIPKVKWTDIGGQSELKQILRQCIEWPIQKPELFKSFNIKPPRGILLYGPPGCSKTMIAKAIATETGLNFLSVKGPEIFDKYVGQSEKSIRKLFHKARLAAPVIIFFDEIDAIASARGNSATNSVSDRVLTQLLTELDGVEKLDDVTIVAATNRPDIIDPALLRPGRIDKLIYVPLPDQETRKQIIDLRLEKLPTNAPENSIDVEELVSRTLGFSGAEVCALCDEAAMTALIRSTTMQSNGNNVAFILRSDFEEAFQKVKPLTDRKAWEKLEHFAHR